MNSIIARPKKNGVMKAALAFVAILYVFVNLQISHHPDHSRETTSSRKATSSFGNVRDTTATGGSGGLVQRLEEFRRGDNDGREDNALNVMKIQKPSLSTNSTNQPEKLQTILDNIYIQTNRPYDGHLWDVSLYVPQWMKGTAILMFGTLLGFSLMSLLAQSTVAFSCFLLLTTFRAPHPTS